MQRLLERRGTSLPDASVSVVSRLNSAWTRCSGVNAANSRKPRSQTGGAPPCRLDAPSATGPAASRSSALPFAPPPPPPSPTRSAARRSRHRSCEAACCSSARRCTPGSYPSIARPASSRAMATCSCPVAASSCSARRCSQSASCCCVGGAHTPPAEASASVASSRLASPCCCSRSASAADSRGSGGRDSGGGLRSETICSGGGRGRAREVACAADNIRMRVLQQVAPKRCMHQEYPP